MKATTYSLTVSMMAAMLVAGCIRDWGFIPGMAEPLPSPTRTVLCRDSLNRAVIFGHECPEGFRFVKYL